MPASRSASRLRSPSSCGTTGSVLPWAMNTGVAWPAGVASARLAAASGRYVDSATIPASGVARRNPAASAIAPPCENPARMTCDGGTPRSPSRAINLSTSAIDSRTPVSSSWRVKSLPKARMSYHARIRTPPLIVTARTGACGNTKRSPGQPGRSNCGTIGAKSLPSAPSPCSQRMLQVGVAEVCCSMVSSMAACVDQEQG